MRETELKAVVPDVEAVRERLQRAGAHVIFRGRMEDRRFDTPMRDLRRQDHVLRVRVERDAPPTDEAQRARLDLKGPTTYDDGYKHREELSARVVDGDALLSILSRLGYEVTREIERDVEVFSLHGAIVRLEHFARMDPLVEVEGEPAAIEAAIATLGIPREAFTAERLTAFVLRYESRTGQRAAISAREAAGDYRFTLEDA